MPRRSGREGAPDDANILPDALFIADFAGGTSKSQRARARAWLLELGGGDPAVCGAAAAALFEDVAPGLSTDDAVEVFARFLCQPGPGAAASRIAAARSAVFSVRGGGAQQQQGAEPQQDDIAAELAEQKRLVQQLLAERSGGNPPKNEKRAELARRARRQGLADEGVLLSPAFWGETGASPTDLRNALWLRFVAPQPAGWQRDLADDMVRICVLWAAGGGGDDDTEDTEDTDGETELPTVALSWLVRVAALASGAAPEAVNTAAAKAREKGAFPHATPLHDILAVAARRPKETTHASNTGHNTNANSQATPPAAPRLSPATFAKLTPEQKKAWSEIRSVARATA